MAFSKLKEQEDRRQMSRKRAVYGCKVATDDGSYFAKCEMLDFSPAGARVRVPDERPLPQFLHLLDFNSRLSYEARVVWRKTPEFGLEFIKAFRFAEVPTKELANIIAEALR